MKQKYAALMTALLLIYAATGCGSVSRNDPSYVSDSNTDSSVMQDATADSAAAEVTEAPQDSSVSFLAVGDNLVQKRVYQSAMDHAEAGQEYNFYYCYQNVADKIAAADLAYINQETLIANDEYEISGSDMNFNSPTALGDEIVDLGFNVINMANNHMLDKGAGGLSATLDYWDKKTAEDDELIVFGAYRDYQDMFDYRITEINGITVGFLAYTEHTNGYALPGDSELEIPYTSDTGLIQQQIQELDSMVDCVVVSAHWGLEDTHVVSDAVKELAADMVEWGADVIIGTHSHTLETMEYLTRSDGSQGFVFYSLGNFISAQTDSFNMVGGMAEFNLVKDGETGIVTVEDVQVTPIITQYDDGSLSNLRIYPYYQYTDELVASHGLPYSPLGTAKTWSWNVINDIVNNNVPAEYLKLTE
jgi:poly-gamma-glutamate synthesis protein (capsule biosynthesis protein)